MSTVAQEPSSKMISTNRERPSISLSLQNSYKKKSIDDRLDTTEHLLNKINRKFDDIFKDGPKINIDIGKIKKSKNKATRKSEKSCSTTKAKYSEKVKNLIQKIIMSRKDMRESNDDPMGLESGDSSATYIMTADSKATMKNTGETRYERIDEESSGVGSENVASSVEATDSFKMSVDNNLECESKDNMKYGYSKENVYFKKVKEPKELIRESGIKFHSPK
jgi:hypothetical protein